MTGFWIYMLVMVLLIPFSMIGFGIYLNNGGPKEISHVIKPEGSVFQIFKE